jgi:hypothetical protein
VCISSVKRENCNQGRVAKPRVVARHVECSAVYGADSVSGRCICITVFAKAGIHRR